MSKVGKAELSFLHGTHHIILFYISTKYHQNIPKGIPVTERTRNLFQTKQRKITPKVKKPELSFLYTTCRLVLFYISTKYQQNIPKGIQVTKWTRRFMLTLTPMPTPTGSVSKTICPPTECPPHTSVRGNINSKPVYETQYMQSLKQFAVQEVFPAYVLKHCSGE